MALTRAKRRGIILSNQKLRFVDLKPAAFMSVLRYWCVLVVASIGCAALSACNTTSATAVSPSSHQYKGAYPIRVVCTTGMVADIARNIGGDKVAVTALMGE